MPRGMRYPIVGIVGMLSAAAAALPPDSQPGAVYLSNSAALAGITAKRDHIANMMAQLVNNANGIVDDPQVRTKLVSALPSDPAAPPTAAGQEISERVNGLHAGVHLHRRGAHLHGKVAHWHGRAAGPRPKQAKCSHVPERTSAQQ